jgi:hypothetical protein
VPVARLPSEIVELRPDLDVSTVVCTCSYRPYRFSLPEPGKISVEGKMGVIH